MLADVLMVSNVSILINKKSINSKGDALVNYYPTMMGAKMNNTGGAARL